MNRFQIIIISIVIMFTLSFLVLFSSLIETQKKELEIKGKEFQIKKEEHIDKIYSVYQGNIVTCKMQAIENKKDEKFIKENCIKPINDSIIANWLKDWGYPELLEEQTGYRIKIMGGEEIEYFYQEISELNKIQFKFLFFTKTFGDRQK